MTRPVRAAAAVAVSVAMLAFLHGACTDGGSGGPKRLQILSSSLPPATEMLGYTFALQGKGGKSPHTWTVIAGTLPSGLTLDPSLGLFSGTPAVGESASSPFPITIELSDGRAKVVTQAFLLVVDPPGGFGGGPLTGTITVVVVEDETKQPLPGAFVMIGPSPDVPFTSNFGITDASGVAIFTDPALDRPASPPVVTAGAVGRQYMSVVGANASQFILPLKPVVDPTTNSRISGLVTGQNTTPLVNLHAAFVIPPIRLSRLLRLRVEDLFVGEECACITCGKLLLPLNLSYPDQDLLALIDGNDAPQKNYSVDLENGSMQHLAATAGFIDIADLLLFVGGGNPNRIQLFTQLQVEGMGVVLDYPVTGPATGVDIPINVPLRTPAGALIYPVDMTVSSSPRGADVFLIAGIDLSGGTGAGQITSTDFGFAPRDMALPQTDTLAGAPDMIPGIGAPGEVAIAISFFDPFTLAPPVPPAELANAFSTVAERTTPFSTPGGITFDSFLDLIPLPPSSVTGGNRTFTYPSAQDAINPMSPVPHYSLSRIARVWEVTPPPLPDPYPGQYCAPNSGPTFTCEDIPGPPPGCPPPSAVTMSETLWEIYTPGSAADTTFDLPTLPPSAPRAVVGGLFDPVATPEPDLTRWTVLSFHSGLAASFDYNAFSIQSLDDLTTHVSLNYLEY